MALCDDIIDYNKKMESYIEKYGNENHVEVKITSYGSGSQLLLNYQKRKFDVIFLDVSMPEMDGFETAEEIRKSDTDVSIVFCTSYYTITNAGKGFEVAAEDFLSKPLLYRKVENILNKIYKKKLLNAEEKLFLKCQDGLITLQLSDIIYIQVRNKLLILHTNKGEIQSSQRMRELEERLSRKLFFRCHNSYIVNFDYVEGLKNDSVLVKDKNQQLTINNMMIELYASMAQAEMEKKEKRQKEGMEAKRLRGEWDEVGRPRAIEQEKFNQEFMRVVQKKVTPTQLQRELGLTSSTYYRYRKNFYENFPEFLQSV